VQAHTPIQSRFWRCALAVSWAQHQPGHTTDTADADDQAHKIYDRSIRNTKADLVAYNRQKEVAMGLPPGTLVPLGTSSDEVAAAGPSKAKAKDQGGLTAAEGLYRDKDTLSYGDSKPSEDAIDRVIGTINKG
jgi:pre-mRNA-splicing factor SYF2